MGAGCVGGVTETHKCGGLAWGHLGSGRDRGVLEPKTVWPWPLTCQFNLGIPSAPLLSALTPTPTPCMGMRA